MPAASTSGIATIAARLATRIDLSSLKGERRDHGEYEIGQSEAPQSKPVMRDLPDAGTQLVDADETIDGRICWKYPAQLLGCVGKRLARPCEAGSEELR